MRRLAFLLVLLMTTQAHATRARLRALNQDVNGSYYLMDTRNIFLNPAQISLMKDHMNIEWGKKERTGIDDANTEAEGGFVMGLGAGKIGAQLGRVTTWNQTIRTMNGTLSDVGTAALGAGNTWVEGQNNLDVMYGGDAGGLRWGGGIGLTRSKSATNTADLQSEVSAYELRGGINTDVFEAFLNVLLGAKSNTEIAAGTTGEIEESFGLQAGGGFGFGGNMRVYANIKYDDLDISRTNNVVDYGGKMTQLMAGFANWHDFDNNARFFWAAEINYLDIDLDDDTAANVNESYKSFQLPVTMGVEADANSWMRARASVRQNVLIGNIKSTNGIGATGKLESENAPNSTSVAAGIGGAWNKFNVDAALVQSLNDDHGRVETSLTYVF